MTTVRPPQAGRRAPAAGAPAGPEASVRSGAASGPMSPDLREAYTSVPVEPFEVLLPAHRPSDQRPVDPVDPVEPPPAEPLPAEPLPAGRRRSGPVPGREPGVVPAILAEALPDGSVRCLACAHRCLVRPGRRGICGVRENRNGTLVSLVYGQAVAANLEPIEKKPLYHAWPGSAAYSISTIGCNFHCRFCQNWEISQAPREGLTPWTIDLPPDEVVARARATGARSIAYTYVEPTIFIEYALDTARLARAAGLGNVFVTNGYQTPEALEVLAPVLDAANVDLKGFSDRFYRRVCGARLQPVLEALALMRRLGIWVEVTTLVVPGLNDDPAELTALAEWIVSELGPETPWHVSRFFPAYQMLDVPPTPLRTLAETARIGRQAGLKHVYPGNAPELGGNDTRCAACGQLLIRRRGYRIVENVLVDGCCPACGSRLAGIGLAEARRKGVA